MDSWKFSSPCVVAAVKFGASEPRRRRGCSRFANDGAAAAKRRAETAKARGLVATKRGAAMLLRRRVRRTGRKVAIVVFMAVAVAVVVVVIESEGENGGEKNEPLDSADGGIETASPKRTSATVVTSDSRCRPPVAQYRYRHIPDLRVPAPAAVLPPTGSRRHRSAPWTQ